MKNLDCQWVARWSFYGLWAGHYAPSIFKAGNEAIPNHDSHDSSVPGLVWASGWPGLASQ